MWDTVEGGLLLLLFSPDDSDLFAEGSLLTERLARSDLRLSRRVLSGPCAISPDGKTACMGFRRYRFDRAALLDAVGEDSLYRASHEFDESDDEPLCEQLVIEENSNDAIDPGASGGKLVVGGDVSEGHEAAVDLEGAGGGGGGANDVSSDCEDNSSNSSERDAREEELFASCCLTNWAGRSERKLWPVASDWDPSDVGFCESHGIAFFHAEAGIER